MKDLLKEMRKMNSNLGGKIDQVQEQFQLMQTQFEDLKKDVQKLEENSVTKTLFQKLEERVAALEQGGLPNTQMNWMSQQINRLDPANKSLALKGFTEMDVHKRNFMIEEILANVCSKTDIQSIEHIGKGPKNDRSLSGVSDCRVVFPFCEGDMFDEVTRRQLGFQKTSSQYAVCRPC